MQSKPGTLGNPVSRFQTGRGMERPALGASRLVRAWHAAGDAWLARRLARVEAELRALKMRLAARGENGQPQFSREDLLAIESCCIESATLRARIERCRTPR